MRYYEAAYRGFVDAEAARRETVPRSPDLVGPERVPGLIDALDCLLALWIAESILGDDGGDAGSAAP